MGREACVYSFRMLRWCLRLGSTPAIRAFFGMSVNLSPGWQAAEGRALRLASSGQTTSRSRPDARVARHYCPRLRFAAAHIICGYSSKVIVMQPAI